LFVYVLRFAILDWGPTILKEWKGMHLSHAGWMVAAFEISGAIGIVACGWITDKFPASVNSCRFLHICDSVAYSYCSF
jgi:sugar phosphate permease